MADKTGIEWTDATWNPVRGCSRVSAGCMNCYAEMVAARFSDPGQAFHGFATRKAHGSAWTGRVELVPGMLDLPLRWRRPRRIFVNSMSDLFHENLSDADIDKVFAVMALAPQHTFQILTKRSARMREYVTEVRRSRRWLRWTHPTLGHEIFDPMWGIWDMMFRRVWLGVSVENQEAADERGPDLQATPAVVRFFSVEPMLGAVEPDLTGINWVICGGESGPGARPMDLNWARALRDQCNAEGIAFFFKQVDKKQPIPDDLLIREFPA